MSLSQESELLEYLRKYNPKIEVDKSVIIIKIASNDSKLEIFAKRKPLVAHQYRYSTSDYKSKSAFCKITANELVIVIDYEKELSLKMDIDKSILYDITRTVDDIMNFGVDFFKSLALGYLTSL